MSIQSVLSGDSLCHIEIDDVLSGLAKLPDESVHCAITSPPYFGLRNYGIENQIGAEKTPQEYVERLTAVFRETRRVLRKDGTFWLNLGDTYATSQVGRNRNSTGNIITECKKQVFCTGLDISHGVKNKDLIGVPWRVAFSLQSDGWYLRDEIIWYKPNPMPASVTDRTTRAHEQVFLLTKNARYFYDNVAIMEESLAAGQYRKYNTPKMAGRCIHGKPSGNEHPDAMPVKMSQAKNRRSVWKISIAPFKGAHFAAYPPALIEPCVLAGTSEHGCCAECGEPYRRITNKQRLKRNRPNDYVKRCEHGQENTCANSVAGVNIETVGWEKNCKCETREIKPCVVLDMFSGAATTGLVCQRLGRRYIGIELNPEYVELSLERLKQDREKKCTTPPAAR